MNLYLRYFDRETLVPNVEEALDFLSSIPEIGMNPDLEADIRDYVASDVCYPKRYKVRQRVYFIIIKTMATTMEDFKDKKAVRQMSPVVDKHDLAASTMTRLTEMQPGWYEGTLDFKRVVMFLPQASTNIATLTSLLSAKLTQDKTVMPESLTICAAV